MDRKARMWLINNPVALRELLKLAQLFIKNKMNFSHKLLVETLRHNCFNMDGTPIKLSNNYARYIGLLLTKHKPALAKYIRFGAAQNRRTIAVALDDDLDI